MSFEGEQVLVPAEAHRMLRSIYGPDHMRIPDTKAFMQRSHDFSIMREPDESI